MSKKTMWAVGVGVVAVVAVIIALIVVNSGSDEPAEQNQNDLPQASEPQGSVNGDDGRGDPPGARLNTEQRSWPLDAEGLSDEQYSTPGQYSVDPFDSRPVFTPLNHDGDLPDRGDLVESMDSCSKDPVPLTGKTQMQYVNARFLTVNSESGPTTMVNDVPGGYAHSPQGAIIAALNQMSYGLAAQGDEVGEEIDKKLWSTSQTVQDMKAERRPATRESMDSSRAAFMPAPWGYKVETCSENVVVVDVVLKEPEAIPEYDRDGDLGVRVTLTWRDGDWVPDFSGTGDTDMKTNRIVDSTDYTKVDYQ